MLTQERLKEVMHYSPETGLLTWLKLSIKNQVKVGDVAGCIDSDTGYVRISIDGERHKGHRLAVLYMTGEWPTEFMDHEDHIRHNNAWLNIRQVSRVENQKNKSMQKNNTSGVLGVNWIKRKKSWQARIGVDGERVGLGQHKHKFEAICARKSAELKYEFHENHGRNGITYYKEPR